MTPTTKKVDNRETIKVVTSNKFVTASGTEKLSLQARKLLYVAISQCKKTDRDFYGFTITAKDFADLMGVSVKAVYKESDKVTNELMSGYIRVQIADNNYRKYNLFSYCEYADGVLSFKLNPDMTDFLLNLRRDFTQPLLDDFLHMRSEMSMAIWHYMQIQMRSQKPQIGSAIEYTCDLQTIREITGTTDTFSRISDFKRFVWDKAIREINDNCGVSIKYTDVKKGRKIVAFSCIASSAMASAIGKISESTKRRAAAGKKRIAAQQQKRG